MQAPKNNHLRKLNMKTYSKQLRAERERFRKRRKDLVKKANELSFFCHTDLYLVMYQSGKYYIYNSTKKQGWPLSEKDLVRKRYCLTLWLITYQNNHNTACDYKTPLDFKSLANTKTLNLSTVENACLFAQESDIEEPVQKNEKGLLPTHQDMIMKEFQKDIEKAHTVRSYIIPISPKLAITSWKNNTCQHVITLHHWK